MRSSQAKVLRGRGEEKSSPIAATQLCNLQPEPCAQGIDYWFRFRFGLSCEHEHGHFAVVGPWVISLTRSACVSCDNAAQCVRTDRFKSMDWVREGMRASRLSRGCVLSSHAPLAKIRCEKRHEILLQSTVVDLIACERWLCSAYNRYGARTCPQRALWQHSVCVGTICRPLGRQGGTPEGHQVEWFF